MSHSLSTCAKKMSITSIPALWVWVWFCSAVWPWRNWPLSGWKEFVDGHLLAQAEFNVFDAGLFEVLTADLGHHCVGEGRIFFARHVHRQVQPALYAVYVLFCKVGSRHAKPSEADICGLSYEESGWSESCLIGSWRKRRFPLVEDTVHVCRCKLKACITQQDDENDRYIIPLKLSCYKSCFSNDFEKNKAI